MEKDFARLSTILKLSMPDKNFSRLHYKTFSHENRFLHLMQLFSLWDNLHEMSKLVFGEKWEQFDISLSSAELDQKVVTVNVFFSFKFQI